MGNRVGIWVLRDPGVGLKKTLRLLASVSDWGTGRLAVAWRVSQKSPSVLGPVLGSSLIREWPRNSREGTERGGAQETKPAWEERRTLNHEVTFSFAFSFSRQTLRLGFLSSSPRRLSGGVCLCAEEAVGGEPSPPGAHTPPNGHEALVHVSSLWGKLSDSEMQPFKERAVPVLWGVRKAGG